MRELFRTVIRSPETHETQMILCESTDFGESLKAARKALQDGAATIGQIDILTLNQIELWSSVWHEHCCGERASK